MNEWKLFNDSVCVKPENEEISVPSDSGMQGEAMPYKLVSDNNVMLAIVSGLLLIVIALQNEKKGIIRILRNCFSTSSERQHSYCTAVWCVMYNGRFAYLSLLFILRS